MLLQAEGKNQSGAGKVLLPVVLLFLGSALLNLSFALATRRDLPPERLEEDEKEYYQLAGEMIAGRYHFNPRRVIGYVSTLAVLRSAFGDRLFLVQLAVTLVFSLLAPCVYLLARRELGHPRAALAAGLGVLVWPLFVRYSATLYSETLATPLFAVFLLTLPGTAAARTCGPSRWLGAGALLGLCMHVRPMYLLYCPFAALIAYWRTPKGPRQLVSPLLLAAGALLVVLPWSAFLSSREGSFVLLSSNGGETFAGGFNPELIRLSQEPDAKYVTPGGRETRIGPGKWLSPRDTGYLKPEEETLSYTRQGELLGQRARAWILAHPGDAAYLAWRKLAYMWGIYPFWNGLSQTVLGNIPTLALLVLGAAALVRFRACWRELALLWTLPLFVSGVALVSWGSWRFRQPGDVGLIILAAGLPWASQVTQALRQQAQSPRPALDGCGSPVHHCKIP